jgi:hypothetical protein
MHWRRSDRPLFLMRIKETGGTVDHPRTKAAEDAIGVALACAFFLPVPIMGAELVLRPGRRADRPPQMRSAQATGIQPRLLDSNR